MPDTAYDISCLENPEVFELGRLRAFSDHDIYASREEAEKGDSSLRESLNGKWRFSYAKNAASRAIGFEKTDHDLTGWDEISVPSHIQLCGYGAPQYVNVQYPWDGREELRAPGIPKRDNPVGSYARSFSVPEAWAGMRVILTFHGVETALFCWVNGVFTGYAEDGFTPSRFDITRALRPGENKLAVEVFRYSSASHIEDQDFWRFSGIFRDVELSAWPRAHVRDIFARAEPDERLENGRLDVELKLDLPESETVTLQARLADARGNVICAASQKALSETRLGFDVSRPLLWSAEEPNLYELEITLRGADGRMTEAARTRVGFRRFELKDGLMLLNGKRIVFRGVNRHEFCSEGGRCITAEHMLSDIRAIKRANINAVRTCHYPNQSLWYKLCDEYGVYLIDEANLESHGSWAYDNARAVPGDDERWLPALFDRAASMLQRDKNHPSVLIWSCGNESFGGSVIYLMSRYLRGMDKSRLVHYEGICFDRRHPDTSDIESQMYTSAEGVAAFIKAHPEKPFILCEYAHAMGNSLGAMHKYTQLEYELPGYQGGFIWDFIDQALLDGKYGGDFGDRPTDREFCGDGLLFADRGLSPKMQEVKYLYQPVSITPDAGGVTLDNRCLFVSTERYDLKWRLMRDGRSIARGVLPAPYVPPGETRWLPLNVPQPEEPGEYLLHCGLYPAKAVAWADTDYELMHGEAVIADIPRSPAPYARDYAVERGDVNAGAFGGTWEMLFSRPEGGLVSLRGADGAQMLITPPELSLYRAPTSNDAGNGDWRSEGLWLAASRLAAFEPVSLETENGLLTARYRCDLPLAHASIDLCCTVLGGGRLLMDMLWPGADGLPDMQAFGLSIRIPGDIRNVTYYGLGPEENYIDRMRGAQLGLFSYDARENLTPYLRPQECGNREGVRFLTVKDDNGRGLRVESLCGPLSVSVLPHSAYELMNARHVNELPEPAYTYLDIALCRKGVGGDDSWGARVHAEYRIPSSQAMRLRFELQIVNIGG